MAINYCKLYVNATYPGVRTLRSTPHQGKRHGVGKKKENRDRNADKKKNRKDRPAWEYWYRERRKGEAGVSGAGSRVRRTKMRTLVGDVSEYQSFYEWEGAD